MIDLQLRDEFKGKRLKGTTVDFVNRSKTGALEVDANDFLRITYPSHDLLKTIEATGPGQSRPVALIGSRGQGKSHLMAALYHLCKNPTAGANWLKEWADRLGQPKLAQLSLRENCHVIAESMHLHVRCKSPEMVHREVWTTILGYNLIRTTAAAAALLHDKQPRQISFTSTCQYVLASWMQLSSRMIDPAILDDYLALMLRQIAGCEVANRPGRLEPRVLKRRRHGYKLMQKPRNVLKRELRKHCT